MATKEKQERSTVDTLRSVWLLRVASDDDSTATSAATEDRFCRELYASGEFDSILVVPLLRTRYLSSSIQHDLLVRAHEQESRSDERYWDAIVFTSRRAVIALFHVLLSTDAIDNTSLEDDATSSSRALSSLLLGTRGGLEAEKQRRDTESEQSPVLWVVGEATREELVRCLHRLVADRMPSMMLANEDEEDEWIRGRIAPSSEDHEHVRNSADLARAMIRRGTRKTSGNCRVLFPCGKAHREELVRTLRDEDSSCSWEVFEWVVYDTDDVVAPLDALSCSTCVSSCSDSRISPPAFIVPFSGRLMETFVSSPLYEERWIEALRVHNEALSTSSVDGGQEECGSACASRPLWNPTFVALGQSTAKTIENCGYSCSQVAEYPTPEHLLQALRRAKAESTLHVSPSRDYEQGENDAS